MSVDDYYHYFSNQYGGGRKSGEGIGDPYFSPRFVQKGYGFGSFMSNLFQKFRPMFSKGLSFLGDEGLRVASNVLSDMRGNKTLSQSLSEQKDVSSKNIANALSKNLAKFAGSGYRKRKASSMMMTQFSDGRLQMKRRKRSKSRKGKKKKRRTKKVIKKRKNQKGIKGRLLKKKRRRLTSTGFGGGSMNIAQKTQFGGRRRRKSKKVKRKKKIKRKSKNSNFPFKRKRVVRRRHKKTVPKHLDILE